MPNVLAGPEHQLTERLTIRVSRQDLLYHFTVEFNATEIIKCLSGGQVKDNGKLLLREGKINSIIIFCQTDN